MLLRAAILIGLPLLLGGIGYLIQRTAFEDSKASGYQIGGMFGLLIGAGTVSMMNRANPVDYRSYV